MSFPGWTTIDQNYYSPIPKLFRFRLAPARKNLQHRRDKYHSNLTPRHTRADFETLFDQVGQNRCYHKNKLSVQQLNKAYDEDLQRYESSTKIEKKSVSSIIVRH